MPLKRGALIIIEGLDRTGKSTQCKKIVEKLKNKNVKAEYIAFPMRHTEIGKLIHSYLQSKKELSDETIHLLFSANRWEKVSEILENLNNGISLIVDRYCYSGVAFSAAKGLDINWCKAPDVGLPKPDKVFFLTMPSELNKQRGGFGNERYEVKDFQEKVSNMYLKLQDDDWEMIDASRSIEVVNEEIVNRTLEVIKNVDNEPIGKVWTSLF